MVPERVALALIEDGWLLRSKVTWDKGRTRPESLAHVRRPGIQSESLFMLTTQMDYVFHHEELVERGDVWHFGPVSGRRTHQAPFPLELPMRCIKVSSNPGDLVLDPFAGSGTTLRAAQATGRRAYGIDLYPPALTNSSEVA